MKNLTLVYFMKLYNKNLKYILSIKKLDKLEYIAIYTDEFVLYHHDDIIKNK